jgi:hypothetical protein
MNLSYSDCDLCAECESLPVTIHPDSHPLLNVPTVYLSCHFRVSETASALAPRSPCRCVNAIDEPDICLSLFRYEYC